MGSPCLLLGGPPKALTPLPVQLCQWPAALGTAGAAKAGGRARVAERGCSCTAPGIAPGPPVRANARLTTKHAFKGRTLGSSGGASVAAQRRQRGTQLIIMPMPAALCRADSICEMYSLLPAS